MFQGNGYLGIRATAEERNLNERRNMFVAGTFDAFNDEVTELPNLPDLLNMGIQINQQIFSLSMGLIENYHKHLNLKNGELIRSFDWLINGNRISFKFSRFVSMSDVHLLVSKLEISSDQSDLKITLNSGIDGQYSNSGTQHLVEGDKRLFEGKILQLQEKTQQSNIGLAFNVLQKAYINKEQLDVKPNIDMGRRQIFDEYNVDLNKGDKFTFVKYANVYTTIDKDIEHETISVASMDAIKKSSIMTYKELLDKSTNAWNINVWQRSLISIDSDDVDPQVAINFARYQLPLILLRIHE
jgi:Trehalose and maltose hydrolases (possible phosphorylases)